MSPKKNIQIKFNINTYLKNINNHCNTLNWLKCRNSQIENNFNLVYTF